MYEELGRENKEYEELGRDNKSMKSWVGTIKV
jgi:hypothetical protein